MPCYVELQSDSTTMTTREPDTDDSWDRGSTHTTWYVEKAFLLKENGYGDSCVYPGNLEVGDKVHVVYAIYSTGDTFGHDENSRMEVISVHKNYELAYENSQILENGVRDKDSGSCHITHDDGTIVPMHWLPWEGYFESLGYISVDTFILEEKVPNQH